MKIAVIGMLCEPRNSTEQALSWNWYKAYQNLGHEVTLYTSASQKQFFTDSDLAHEEIFFVPDNSSSVEKSPHSIIQAFRLLTQIRNWNKHLKDISPELQNFELVHQVSISTIRVTTPLLFLNEKLIWGPLGGGHLGYLSKLPLRSLPLEMVRNMSVVLTKYVHKFTKRFQGFNGIVLTTNEETAAFAKQLTIKNVIKEVSDGISQDWLLSSVTKVVTEPTSAIKILWAGRLVPSKRPDLSISILKTLREMGLDSALTIAGSGPSLNKLIQQVHRWRLVDFVRFTGTISHEQIKSEIDSSTHVIFTSFRDSSSPLMLEALARGRQCIAIRSQGIKYCYPINLVKGPPANISLKKIVKTMATDISSEVVFSSEEAMKFAQTNLWVSKAKRVLSYWEIAQNQETDNV